MDITYRMKYEIIYMDTKTSPFENIRPRMYNEKHDIKQKKYELTMRGNTNIRT